MVADKYLLMSGEAWRNWLRIVSASWVSVRLNLSALIPLLLASPEGSQKSYFPRVYISQNQHNLMLPFCLVDAMKVTNYVISADSVCGYTSIY